MSDKNKKNKEVDDVQQKQEHHQQKQEPEKNSNKIKDLLPTILRMVFFFILYKVMSEVAQNKINKQNSTKQPPQFVDKSNNQMPNSKVLPNQNDDNFIFRNIWKTNENTKTDLYVYLSEKEIFTEFNDMSKLLWNINDIKYHDWNVNYNKEFEVELPKSVLNNGTYYLHSYLTFSGISPNPQSASFDRKKITYNKKLLTSYKKKKKVIVKKKLFAKNEKEDKKDEIIEKSENPKDEKDLIISYWNPELIINSVPDTKGLYLKQLHPDMFKDIIFVNKQKKYHPILYMNDFWQLNEHELEINKTSKILPLKLSFYPISFTKYQMYVAMGYSFKVNNEMFGANEANEFDEVKVNIIILLLLILDFFEILYH